MVKGNEPRLLWRLVHIGEIGRELSALEAGVFASLAWECSDVSHALVSLFQIFKICCFICARWVTFMIYFKCS